jgi:hypothetical protein
MKKTRTRDHHGAAIVGDMTGHRVEHAVRSGNPLSVVAGNAHS